MGIVAAEDIVEAQVALQFGAHLGIEQIRFGEPDAGRQFAVVVQRQHDQRRSLIAVVASGGRGDGAFQLLDQVVARIEAAGDVVDRQIVELLGELGGVLAGVGRPDDDLLAGLAVVVDVGDLHEVFAVADLYQLRVVHRRFAALVPLQELFDQQLFGLRQQVHQRNALDFVARLQAEQVAVGLVDVNVDAFVQVGDRRFVGLHQRGVEIFQIVEAGLEALQLLSFDLVAQAALDDQLEVLEVVVPDQVGGAFAQRVGNAVASLGVERDDGRFGAGLAHGFGDLGQRQVVEIDIVEDEVAAVALQQVDQRRQIFHLLTANDVAQRLDAGKQAFGCRQVVDDGQDMEDFRHGVSVPVWPAALSSLFSWQGSAWSSPGCAARGCVLAVFGAIP